MPIGAKLKELRKEKGITQQELAIQTGLSKSAIINYENDLREPNAKAMRALENYFCVSAEYLYGRTEENSFYEDEEIQIVANLFKNKVDGYSKKIMQRPKPERQLFNDILMSTMTLIEAKTDTVNNWESIANNRELCQKWVDCYETMEIMDSDDLSTLIRIMSAYCEQDRFTNANSEEKMPVSIIKLFDSAVSAGDGIYVDYSGYENIEINEDTEGADYAVKVSGNSMEPRFFDGDIVLVEIAQTVEVGEIGIFNLNGQAFIKERGEKALISLNKDYDPIVVKPGDSIACQGRVIKVLNMKKGA
ncbi:MAG: LexA family transcriptional regulator [Ruminococcus sp.]|nr:LexA family transcriptional regulator [Ruminococcus sp.]